VTSGIPKPKYSDADKTANPERYNKQLQEYYVALKKFIAANPSTVSGIELELTGVNPQAQWSKIQSEHSRRVLRLAPEFAQTKYLAGKTDTDLDGRARGVLDQHAESGCQRGGHAAGVGRAGDDPRGPDHASRADQPQRRRAARGNPLHAVSATGARLWALRSCG
jgi:hypothetical protein